MVEKRKHHFDLNSTKTEIIRYILESGPVSEPDISKFMNVKYGGFDRSTVSKHLSSLAELSCIEKVSPKKKSRLNYWDIKTLRNLKNIRFNFSEISLNKKEKSLMIVLKELGYDLNSTTGLSLYIQLYTSVSFYNICLETRIDTLRERSWEVYLRNEGFKNALLINQLIKELYDVYVKDRPNFEIPIEFFGEVIKTVGHYYDGYIEKPVSETLEKKITSLEKQISMNLFQFPLELLQTIEEKARYEMTDKSLLMSYWNNFTDRGNVKNMFLEIFLKTSPKSEEVIYIIKNFKEKISEEIYSKTYGEIFTYCEIGKKTSLDEFKKILNKNMKAYNKLTEIFQLLDELQRNSKNFGNELQLQHFINHDTLIGADPDKEFMNRVNEKLLKNPSMNFTIASEFIVMYKQPSMFYISDDSNIIYEMLMNFYKEQF
jgi:hypothetical protein